MALNSPTRSLGIQEKKKKKQRQHAHISVPGTQKSFIIMSPETLAKGETVKILWFGIISTVGGKKLADLAKY